LAKAVCLHRIHERPQDVPHSYHELGMTISIESLLNKLRDLDSKNVVNDQRSFVTFDDGWKDVLLIPDGFFKQHETLTPVIFLTDDQLLGNKTAMPLHRLYRWMEEEKIPMTQLSNFAIQRTELKNLRQQKQHEVLSKTLPPIIRDEAYLEMSAVEMLMAQGWLFASHGPEHSDLRQLDDETLCQMLTTSLALLTTNGMRPWLAWPEGRWDNRVHNIAKSLGFEKQFGLFEEERKGTAVDVVLRFLW
jgi:hypothetical protein